MKEKTTTKETWKTLWFGLSAFFVPQILYPSISPFVVLQTPFLLLVFFSFKSFLKAYKLGERSFILWIGFFFSILTIISWIGGLLFPPLMIY